MRLDAFPLAKALIHGSPADVATWPVTVGITTSTMTPGASGGVSFEFDAPIPDSWNYHVPGWGNGTTDPGNVQFTVWAGAQLSGQWHMAAFIQMWPGRPSTGASLPSHWADWAYDPTRWGAELVNYAPQPGDQMAFFITAGNGRDATGITSVAERSNIVFIDLFSNETSHTVYDTPVITPAPTPTPVPAPVLASQDPLPLIAQMITTLAQINLKLDAFATRKAPTYTGSLFGAKVIFTPNE